MSNQHDFPQKKQQQGFTLIELLVVVSVLAAMAGIAAVAMDGYEQDAQEQLVETEMKRIASAIYRFKEDTGYFPEQGMFPGANSNDAEQSDFSWLFSSPADGGGEILPWDSNSGRGWHGPYLELSSQNQLVVNSAICGLPDANFDTGFDGNQSVGLTDAFERNTFDAESCAAIKYDGEWVRREFTGQAYRYDTDYENDDIDLCSEDATNGNGCVVIASAGADSQYGTSDDLVSVLRAK